MAEGSAPSALEAFVKAYPVPIEEPAQILERRSAGIIDLRHGALLDSLWTDSAPSAASDAGQFDAPLLPNVTYFFVATTMTKDAEHSLGHLMGDLLVRVPSGSGPRMTETTFPIERECFGGIMHHQLQNHPEVYDVVRRGCDASRARRGLKPRVRERVTQTTSRS